MNERLGNNDDPFVPILDQLNTIIESNTDAGAYAFQQHDFEPAATLADRGQQLVAFQAKVVALHDEWQELTAVAEPSPMPQRRFVPVVTWRGFGAGIKAMFARIDSWMVWSLICLVAGQQLFVYGQKDTATLRNQISVYLHILAFGLGFLSMQRDVFRTPMRLWKERWLLALLFVLAVLTRFVWLSRVPYILDGDAGAFANAALPFVNNQPDLTFFGTGWQGHTNGYFWMLAQVLKLFDVTVLGIRAFSAVGGVLGVFAIYWMGRSLIDVRTGFLAGLVTAVLPFDLVFSRIGTEVIQLTWVIPLVITLIWFGWQRHSLWILLLAGGFTGFSQYLYPGARFIPILATLQIGSLLLFPVDAKREWRWAIKALMWVIIGFLLVYGPMIAYFLQHQAEYMARIKTVSIISSGWIDREAPKVGFFQLMSEQVRRAYSVWLFPVNGARLWYLDPQYLSTVNATLFAFGLFGLVFSWSMRGWLRVFLALYLVVGIFLAGVMTIDTPMPSRYVIFIPAVVLLIAWSMNRFIAQFDGIPSGWQSRLSMILLIGMLGMYSVQNVRDYARHDTQTNWTVSYNVQLATVVTHYLLNLPNQDYTVLYLQDGGNYFHANPSLPVLTKKAGVNIPRNADCASIAASLRTGQNVIIAPASRIPELYPLSQRLNGAEISTLRNPKGQDLAVIMRFFLQPNQDALLICNGSP